MGMVFPYSRGTARGRCSTTTHVLDRTTMASPRRPRQGGQLAGEGVRERAVLARDHQGPCPGAVCACVCVCTLVGRGAGPLHLGPTHAQLGRVTQRSCASPRRAPDHTARPLPDMGGTPTSGSLCHLQRQSTFEIPGSESTPANPHQGSELFPREECINARSHSPSTAPMLSRNTT